METQSHQEEKNLMSNEAQDSHLRHKRRKKICMISICVIGVLVALAILFTILAFTIFKPKRPETIINTVSLQDFDAKIDITQLKLLINLTLIIDLSVKNPNRVGFKYEQSVAYLRYKDQDVGEAPIEEGEIGKKEIKPMNLTMTLMADKLLADSDVYSQALSGSLPLSTSVELEGKIQLLFKIKVKAYSTCNFNINVNSQALSDLSCHYKTEL